MSSPNIVEQAFVYKGVSTRVFAKEIGLGHGAIDAMRHGKRAIPPWVAGKCAEILGRDWTDGVTEVMEVQARSEAEKSFWKERLRQGSKNTAVLTLAAYLGVFAPSMKSHATLNRDITEPSIHSASLYVEPKIWPWYDESFLL